MRKLEEKGKAYVTQQLHAVEIKATKAINLTISFANSTLLAANYYQTLAANRMICLRLFYSQNQGILLIEILITQSVDFQKSQLSFVRISNDYPHLQLF